MTEPLILQRFQETSFQSLTPSQAQVDGLVSRFAEEACDWRTLAAMATGSLFYRVGRVGTLALASQASQAAPLLQAASYGIGLASEVTAFQGVNDLLSREAHSPRETYFDRWRTSFVQFGLLKLAGGIVPNENILLQHALQDTAMVGGHQLTSRLGWTSAPEGSLAEQFLHAEATNLQLAVGMGLLHSAAPGIHALERSLDLSIQSRSVSFQPERFSGDFQAGPIPAAAAEGVFFSEGISSPDPLQVTHVAMSMEDGNQGSARPHRTSQRDNGTRRTNGKSAERTEEKNSPSLPALERLLGRQILLTEERKRELIAQIQAGLVAEHELLRAYLPYLVTASRILEEGEPKEFLPLVQEGWKQLRLTVQSYRATTEPTTDACDPFHRAALDAIDLGVRNAWLENKGRTSLSEEAQISLDLLRTHFLSSSGETPIPYAELLPSLGRSDGEIISGKPVSNSAVPLDRLERGALPDESLKRWGDLAPLLLDPQPYDRSSNLSRLLRMHQSARAESELVRGHLRFLLSVARDFGIWRRQDFIEMMNEGWKGLRRAAQKFDLERRTDKGEPIQFMTYAGYWIEQAVSRYLTDTGRNVRIPAHMMERIRKLRRIQSEMEGRREEPTVAALSKALGYEPEKVQRLLELEHSMNESRLDAPLASDEGGKRTRLDLISDSGPNPEEEVGRRRLRKIFEGFANQLGDKEKAFFERRMLAEEPLGFDAFRDIGLSKDAARQMEGRLLLRLKKYILGLEGVERPAAPSRPSFARSSRPPRPSSPRPPAPDEGNGSSGEEPNIVIHVPPVPLLPGATSQESAPAPELELQAFEPRIAILGFGAAGMGASHHLRLPHTLTSAPELFRPKITVFEGMPRPGGKIAPDNLGAQFADLNHFEPVSSMLRRLHLKTFQVPDYDEADFTTREGQRLAGSDFIRALQTLRSKAVEALQTESWQELDGMGAVDFIGRLYRAGHLNAPQREAMTARLGFEEGTLDVSAALSFAINLAKSATPCRAEIEGGFFQFAKAEMQALIASRAGAPVFSRQGR
ncbi:MAG: hypothetical protein U1F57_11295 [bacterium]